LPSLVNIGASYDYYLSKENNNQRITAALNFTSNSFTQDQFNIGFEYGFKQMFMLRAGMVYEKGIFNADERQTALTGPYSWILCRSSFRQRKQAQIWDRIRISHY
jgi:hypothetical protein